MPRIVGPDSDIVRKMFLEATQAVGCTAIFHELISSTNDLYNDPTTNYLPAITLDVLFDENPKVKMLKDLGWYNEDEEIRPLLVYLPIYKNAISKDLLNVMENCLIELVYMGVNKTAIFRITAKRMDSLFGNYWICKCVPERKIVFNPEPSYGFNFLDAHRDIGSTDSGENVEEMSDPSLYSLDTSTPEDTLTEFGKIVGDSGISGSSSNNQVNTYNQDIGFVNDLNEMGINTEDNAEFNSFFDNNEVPVNDMGESSNNVSNNESSNNQSDNVSGNDDYSNIVMG